MGTFQSSMSIARFHARDDKIHVLNPFRSGFLQTQKASAWKKLSNYCLSVKFFGA